jgi:hypothetical protein
MRIFILLQHYNTVNELEIVHMSKSCRTHEKDNKGIRILVAKTEVNRLPGGLKNILKNKIKEHEMQTEFIRLMMASSGGLL